MKQYPSIFNDVIGPVMVGPSSSHTAASVRIGNIIRQLVKGQVPYDIAFNFDINSSLATTYNTQGVDVGLAAGILNLQTYQPELMQGLELAKEAGIKISFNIKDLGLGHPNMYYINIIKKNGDTLKLKALSTGGGMIEIVEFQGFPLSITGGFYEFLIISKKPLDKKLDNVFKESNIEIIEIKNSKTILYQIKSEIPFKDYPILSETTVFTLVPVLPVVSQLEPFVPFVTADEALKYNKKDLQLWELACIYESARSGLPQEEVLGEMIKIIEILDKSLKNHKDSYIPGRILQSQSQNILGKNLIGGEFQESIIYYITRFMEIKSANGVFVAAPTAGSCGCLAGTIFALKKEHKLSKENMAKAMLAAGLIGVFIAHGSTFSAELCGCQAECGAGSGMCAAACAHILQLDASKSIAAASMALQNIFGMICDPVANLVEVPCLGKNIMGAVNAVSSANMASAGFSQVIPLDETISAMDQVGKSLPMELRCTGLGGLSITPTAQKIKDELVY